MFYVYKITINNKLYIGYTGQTVEERFHKHKLNAQSGLDTHLYRAMRKYGYENCKHETIKSFEIKEEAMLYEKKLIEEYDTIKNGMNMAIGGSGGNTRIGMTDDKYKSYCDKISKVTTGENNPNHSGYSDTELIQFGVDLVNEYGYFSIGIWNNLATKKGLPRSFSKNRFGGRFNNFKSEIQKHFDFDITYKVNDKHKESLSIIKRKYSDDELIDFGIKLVNEYGYFIKDIWRGDYHKLYGVPKSFSRGIFNGSLFEFRKQIASTMGVSVESITDPFQYKHKKNREKYRNSQKQN